MTWWRLCEALYNETWPEIMSDDHDIFTDHPRAMDGLRLRVDFSNRYLNSVVPSGPVSMLEIMIGMARWMEFNTSLVSDPEMVAAMFWQMVQNIHLDHLPDTEWEPGFSIYEVGEAVRKIKERDYLPNGDGGFFPRYTWPDCGDVRTMTLWEQMQGWLVEHYR